MRTALAIVLAAGLAGSAVAQEPAPGAAAAAAPPPPVAPADPAQPAAPAAGQPAAPTASAPAEPPPTLPTSGDAAQVISVLDNICKPLVRGGSLDQLAPAQGFKKNRRDRSYTATLGTKPYTITIADPGSNKDVCSVTLNYAIGQHDPIVKGLAVWSFLQQPRMTMQRNDFATGADGIKRTTLSWEHYTNAISNGLVFVRLNKPDDSPLAKNYDQATLLYSERQL